MNNDWASRANYEKGLAFFSWRETSLLGFADFHLKRKKNSIVYTSAQQDPMLAGLSVSASGSRVNSGSVPMYLDRCVV